MFSNSMPIKMRNIILPLLMINIPVMAQAGNWNSGGSSSVVSSTDIRLDCEVTSYTLSGYSEKWSKSWVPPRYSVIISGGKVELMGRTVTGRVTRDTSKRVEVVFDGATDTRNDGGFLKGTYFKTNSKFMARVGFNGGYQDSGPIWGLCQETSISSSNSASSTTFSTPASPTSSTNLDKAKSTCTDIGFTSGTEKFGECVLKVMDK